jgi:hypothetical protein
MATSDWINLGGSVGLLIALFWMAAAAMRLLEAVQAATLMEVEINEAADHMEDEISKVAANREKLTLEIEKLELGRDRARRALDKLEAELTPEAMAGRTRHYILADRRAANDIEWLVPISCPNPAARHWHPWYIQSWIKPRSYLCWAPTADAARRAADARFPSNAGFIIGNPVAPPVSIADPS